MELLNQTETIAMFRFKFAAICRTDRKNHIHHLSTIADSEIAARRQLSGKFVLFFQARLPAAGGAA
ncbi:host cell division inhibitor Icd-like protein [Citrobacter freundii]